MKAVVKIATGPGNIAYADRPEPEVRAGQVLIEVRAAGLCGTDLSLYNWADAMVREFRPAPPLIMGHEFAGVIAAVGAGTSAFAVGERVTANPILSCGACAFCQAGQPSICNNRPQLGLQLDGCFARFVAIRQENVYRVSSNVPFETAAVSELLCVALHALERVPVCPGETVAIVGSGPMGFLMLLTAQAAGASRLLMTGLETDRSRLAVAEALGAEIIVADTHDPAQRAREMTHGLGADVVFECAGQPGGFLQALSLVRKGGKIGILGQGSSDASFNSGLLSYRETTVTGIRSYDARAWRRSQDLLASGRLPLHQMITHQLPLEEVVQAIGLMQSRQALKVLLLPRWA